MSRIPRTFSLEVVPDDAGAYHLDLKVGTNGEPTTVATLSGGRLDRLRPSVVNAVVASDHARTVLSPTRKAPILLTEDAGVRLGLVALATAPLSKPARVDAIRQGVDGMTNEEALYWYAYTTGPNASRALRALRTLLAEE